MTDEQIKELEQHTKTLEDAAQRILGLSMGDRPFTYNRLAIEFVYRILDKGVSFERLVQVLNAHQTARETITL